MLENRFDAAWRRRKEIIHNIVLVTTQDYDVLEEIVEYWNENVKGIDVQTLIDKLYCNTTLFPSENARYLCQRGFVSKRKDGTFIPTHRGADAYRKIHKGAKMASNCTLPDY